MKLRHFLLFFTACITLIAANFPGGPLLGLLVWLQVNTLLTQSFNKTSQIWALKLFLISVPLLLFWGSIHSFFFIYMKEQSWLFFLMTLALNCCLSMIAAIYFFFSFDSAANCNFQVISTLDASWAVCKKNKSHFFKISLIIFTFSLVPFLSAEWKIVFAVMATHLYLNRARLKQVFESGF